MGFLLSVFIYVSISLDRTYRTLPLWGHSFPVLPPAALSKQKSVLLASWERS